MRQPCCILDVLGDVRNDGELRFVGAAKTLEAAKRRIRALGQSNPGEFVIYNQQTGQRVSVKAGAEKASAPLRPYFGRGFWKPYRAKGQKEFSPPTGILQ